MLSEVKKRNNDHIVTDKMKKTFSYRRQEVLQAEPMVADFKSRWPALFIVKEVQILSHQVHICPHNTHPNTQSQTHFRGQKYNEKSSLKLLIKKQNRQY